MPAVDPPTSPEPDDGSEVDLADNGSVWELLLDREDAQWTDGGGSEGRWTLWQQFMEEHAHLDAWLRSAEEAAASAPPAHVSYGAAKAALTRYQRLRREAGSRLAQLDGLSRRNRTLGRLFGGAVRARLLAAARDCGRRWDDVSARLASITVCLQLFVSEWEEFEAQREEFALWLAEVDASLTEVDHLRGDACEKLRRLQSFQQCVCVNSGRVSALLRRGEALIQRSEPADAQRVEGRLLELLRHCSHVHNNIARMHTRLLSMRLVFEDDWLFSPATDSGCPSEALLEEEGALEKLHLDLPAVSNRPDSPTPSCNSASSSSLPRRPPPSPNHEHQGLEWDPSVDIGRPVSRDDADSSYFSISTGLCHRDGGLKRRSLLSHCDSGSNITSDIIKQEADPDRWTTSTPDRQDGEPGGFDGGWVNAWLQVQSSAPSGRRTSCSKAVQTEEEEEVQEETVRRRVETTNQARPAAGQHALGPAHSRSLDRDAKASSDWPEPHTGVRATCCRRAVPSAASSSAPSWCPAALPPLLLGAALALLAFAVCFVLEPPCRRGNGMPPSFHLALTYVRGPPPT